MSDRGDPRKRAVDGLSRTQRVRRRFRDWIPGRFFAVKERHLENIRSLGQSSPIVVGGRLFLTASDGDRLLTICMDAKTGKELWRREIRRERTHKLFRANDPASPTPAADDSGVFVFFPDFGIVSYTPEGKERWRHPLGPFRNFYGMAASPVVAGDLVALVCDQQTGSFVIALDRRTGLQRWKTERPGLTVGWATPMVFRPAKGPAELIVLGS